MKEITYFYLASCPYCRKADRLLERLVAENPEFAEIPITRIEESENPGVVQNYDYKYVPCFWIGQDKLFEGVPTKKDLHKVLEAALD